MKFDNETLIRAITNWCDDPRKAEVKYDHISKWDTSKVTSMKDLFDFSKERVRLIYL
tara:strand:- start:1478 stop:1648 length:171 start_codon:yes stop_codon:yes gene_type:complete